MIALLWLACTPAPTITSVSPAEGLPGTPIRVLGEGFGDDARLSLVRAEDAVPIEATVRGAMLIEATLPEQPGTWTVEVAQGSGSARLADALTVLQPAVEEPCGGKWKANAQVSKAREVVVIDRFAGEQRDTHRIPFSEVAGIEYELVKLDDDKLCSVIYVKKADGTRVPFDDDTRLNLGPRAYKLGNVIGKPTTVTRQDVEDDPRPVEQD